MSFLIKTEDGLQNIAGGGGGASSADKISYDNTASELTATTVQGAVDEIKEEIDSKVTIPQTATVGQILSVKAVDGEGKPTEWETADKPEGFNYPDETARIGQSLYVKSVDDEGKPIFGYKDALDPDIFASYDKIASIVRAGKAEEVFKIGDQIMTTYTDTDGNRYEMPWDIVAFRETELEDGSKVPGMIIQSHYATVEKLNFDEAEPNSSNSDIKLYGANRWIYSSVRQWLNSDKEKGMWWESQYSTDVAPTVLNSINGFMKGLPTEFIDMLKPTKHKTAVNYIYPVGSADTYSYDTTLDIFFLPSMNEEYCRDSSNKYKWDVSGQEGAPWAYWAQRRSPTQDYLTTNTNAIRYRLDNNKLEANITLRSCTRNSASSVYYVGYTSGGSSGILSTYRSDWNNLWRFAPAAIIC